MEYFFALHGDRPLLEPRIGKEKLMRDPCILCGPDSVFRMVWTPSWNDTVIGYASSRDLIDWSEQLAIPVMAHEPATRNCWVPELFYDDVHYKYLRWTSAWTAMGPYGPFSDPITGDYWAEGPSAIMIGDWWYVYFDRYREKRYGAVRSKDLQQWEDISSLVSFPEGARHGTVFEVVPAVLERLIELR